MKTKIEMVGFDYYSATTLEEIDRVLTTLLATPAGTCAGDRNYGIDHKVLDLPVTIAQNRLALELAEKIPEYEPRVEIDKVSCTANSDGTILATVRIKPNQEYTGS